MHILWQSTVFQDGAVCRTARPACEDIFQYSSIYCHYPIWYVNYFYEYLNVYWTHIYLIDFVILLLFLNNIYIFTLYNSNVNILWNFFCTELKYVLLEGKLFHPRCYSYLLNIHYCYSLTGGRVCNKGLCFKTEPCAGRPGQPAKMCLNIRSCVCNKYIMYVMGKLTITKH